MKWLRWLRLGCVLVWFTIVRPARALVVRARRALRKRMAS